MRRLQVTIDDETNDALERLAKRRKTTKAALIREYVRHGLRPRPPHWADPLTRMVGADSVEPEDIDEVVYGSPHGLGPGRRRRLS